VTSCASCVSPRHVPIGDEVMLTKAIRHDMVDIFASCRVSSKATSGGTAEKFPDVELTSADVVLSLPNKAAATTRADRSANMGVKMRLARMAANG
jgi:hypothetical protein